MSNKILNNQRFPSLCSDDQQAVPITLLHGWGVDERCWDDWVPQLQTLGPVHVISLDYEGADVDRLCQQIQSVMMPFSVLVGWSLGGMLAAKVAARFPDQVAGLITLAANQQFVAGDQWPHAMAQETFDHFYRAMKHTPEKTLKRFMGLVVQGDEHTRDQRRYLRTTKSLTSILTGLDILCACDNQQDYAAIRCPVLQCFGAHDQLVPVAVMDQLQQRYPQHQFHRLDHAGHCLHYPAQRLMGVLILFVQSLVKKTP